MIDQFNFTSDAEQEVGAVGYIWRKVLEALANVNNVIEYAPPLMEKFPNQKGTIEYVQAQALFLRALCHFDLFRVYAQPYNYTADASHLGVPILLVTPGGRFTVACFSQSGVRSNIERFARRNCSSGTAHEDAYHASKEAVWIIAESISTWKIGTTRYLRIKVIDTMPLAKATTTGHVPQLDCRTRGYLATKRYVEREIDREFFLVQRSHRHAGRHAHEPFQQPG